MRNVESAINTSEIRSNEKATRTKIKKKMCGIRFLARVFISNYDISTRSA